MKIKQRSRLNKILIAPKHFYNQLQIGKSHVSFLHRFYSAYVFTLLLIKNKL